MAYVDKDGYVRVYVGGSRVHRPEHVLVAEAALGRPLPRGAVVHHVDEDRANNATSNLVVCPDRAYHNLLHKRADALSATGNADALKCCRCLEYDSPENVRVSGNQAYHAACNAAHARTLR